ncbi:hypothetical protein LQU94_07550 [Peptoniphilus sp. KCTC 25270]|uniref:DapH/DapD/GlmU-related protein n=1 Tax=Peptoniphilus sp. KCTC 25270 TaxID=2897414 RepID=UPI001E483140|nr:DapH/DapD/GlmU-related protein [Peptoniphilus sp. KCTC 25270]MCD1147966.1 hypothetical protein [Peptoniphilus sp. KCTC 25270]
MKTNKNTRSTTRVLGEVKVAENSLLSYGVTCDGRKNPITIGDHSMILENSLVESTENSPVKIGEKTVLGHRCHIRGANIGSFCEIGNGVKIGEDCYVGDWVILGEGTVLPDGAKAASHAVIVGNPFSVIRGLTIEDKEMIKKMRRGNLERTQGETYPLPQQEPAENPETFLSYKEFTPEAKAPTLGARVEIIGKVKIDEGAHFQDDVKIIGDSHGSVSIGKNVSIGEGTVVHMLPDFDVVIGDNVKIGPRCIIHGTKIGNGAVIEEDVILSDGSIIGENTIVEKGSLVPQRVEIEGNKKVSGYPIKG